MATVYRKRDRGSDPVNHQAHYTFGKFEVLDVIEDWNLGYNRSCVIEYIARAGKKQNELEDLKKARFYLDREIKKLEEKDEARQPV